MFEASGKYRLDARLGGGGMAEVFVGSALGAEGFQRKIAIKRVLPGFSDNPAFAQMFVEEARISSRLVHPNIVSVLDFDRDLERRLFLVMELVEGKDLDALMGSGLLPFPVVAFVTAEVLRGLGYAHDLPVTYDGSVHAPIRGVVHRDVSPHNVLLSWEGAAKVSDFGIAKAREASEATASVFIKGKPAYMSPEQANGEKLDGRSDLFAVGVMVWEMLTGQKLFLAEDTRATLAKVLFGVIARPRSIRSDVPKDLDRVCMKLLERDLGARYATAEQAIADLLKCECAPRNGREVLGQCLAERFPHQAPIRHSVLKSRSVPPMAPAPSQIATPVDPTGATIVSGSGTNTYAGEMPAKPAGRGLRIALVAMVAVAGGVGGFLIVRGTGGGANKDAPIDAAPAAVAKATVPDAPPPAPPDAAAPPDTEAPPDTAPPPPPPPPKDAGITPKPPPPKDAGPKKDAQVANTKQDAFGTITVTCKPVAKLSIDGGPFSTEETPITMRVKAGTHTFRVVNRDSGFERSRTIDVPPDQTTTIVFP